MQNRFTIPDVVRVPADDLPDELISVDRELAVEPPHGYAAISLFHSPATLCVESEGLEFWEVDAFLRPHRQVGQTLRFRSLTEPRDGDTAVSVAEEYRDTVVRFLRDVEREIAKGGDDGSE